MKNYKVQGNIKLQGSVTKEVIEKAQKKLEKLRKKISKRQDAMYAHGKYSMLVCLQGMDTSGKDSLIREVFKDVNARGVVVYSFKVPTEKELKHDFLWRHLIALPERGKIGVFNRTHYENVLVTRVHPEYILGENIPSIKSVDDLDDTFYHNRMDAINNFEKHISDNGMIVLKFFLNLSKDEQKNRLLRRLNIEEKNWKFSPGDLKERKLWDKYQDCYEDAINRTNKDHAPWYVVPADDKPTARLIVAQAIYDALKAHDDIEEPRLPAKYQAEIENYKKELNDE
ncbi:PPK2 family polyphosphate kinase [Urechidicola croceus]|uniref:Phosphate--nucleotide phosphotransferase n=1 Tax=Urechidicola croceus TaxID=1850246 RepID=A0A1D8PBF9_9FLAO|nr:PPK2 family polyphosphate kinase [Urechidicola croceus]AOW21917.1 phosphate--nucleotide phosphotransferase [Urechidicola croceus]